MLTGGSQNLSNRQMYPLASGTLPYSLTNNLQDRSTVTGIQIDGQYSSDQQEMMRTQAKQIEGAIRLLQMQHEVITRALINSQQTISEGTHLGTHPGCADGNKLQTQTSFKVQFALPSQSLPAIDPASQAQINQGFPTLTGSERSSVQGPGSRLLSSHGYDIRMSSTLLPQSDFYALQNSIYSHPSTTQYFQCSASAQSSTRTTSNDAHATPASADLKPSERKRALDLDDDDVLRQSAAKSRFVPPPNAGKLILDAEVSPSQPLACILSWTSSPALQGISDCRRLHPTVRCLHAILAQNSPTYSQKRIDDTPLPHPLTEGRLAPRACARRRRRRASSTRSGRGPASGGGASRAP